jgi:microcystin-dependent protein
MAKKEFSEDFNQFVGALTGGERVMIENPATGEEFWTNLGRIVEFISEVKTGTVSLYPVSAHVNLDGHFIMSMSNGSEIDAGYIGIYKSAYQSYLATTTDDPVKSEADWVLAQKGAPGYNGKNATFKKGEIRSFHGYFDEAPEGTHFCDGTDVPGYGKVADLRGVSIIGLDPRKPATPVHADDTTENYGAIGNTGGKASVQLTVDEMPEHSHTTDETSVHAGGSQDMESAGGSARYTSGTGKTGGNQAHENRGPYYVLAFYEVITEDAGEGGLDTMNKSVYDTNNSGVVDNSEKLGNSTKEEIIAAATQDLSPYQLASPGEGLTPEKYTLLEKQKLSALNEHWRGKHVSIDALIAAIQMGNDGDYATIDAGTGSDSFEAIWDSTDSKWIRGSGQPITTDQSIQEGSSNPVSGAAVFIALRDKSPKNHNHKYSDLEELPDLTAYVEKTNGKIPLSVIPVNEVVSGGNPTLGEAFGGGKIFHILEPGQSGYEVGKTKVLIVALEDATSCVWSFKSVFDSPFWRFKTIATTLPDLGEGRNNTTEILAFLEANTNPGATLIYATEVAKNYNVGGFTDGYLPSQDELAKLSAMNRIGALTGFLGSVNPAGYWSSTESGSDAVYVKLNAYGDGTSSKDSIYAVRAIRMAEYSTSDGVMIKSENIDSQTGKFFPALVPAAAYDSEVVAVSGSNVALKNRTESYAGILTGTNTFTILMPDPISGKVNESAILFRIGASLPNITWPAGIIWMKNAPTLTTYTVNVFQFKQVFTGSTWETWGSY